MKEILINYGVQTSAKDFDYEWFSARLNAFLRKEFSNAGAKICGRVIVEELKAAKKSAKTITKKVIKKVVKKTTKKPKTIVKPCGTTATKTKVYRGKDGKFVKKDSCKCKAAKKCIKK